MSQMQDALSDGPAVSFGCGEMLQGCAQVIFVENSSREREQTGCQARLPSQSKAVTCHVTLGMHLAFSGQVKRNKEKEGRGHV